MQTTASTATMRLAQILQTESEDSLNRSIAQIVIQQMPNIEQLSTNDMARLCNISKTSFIRFCRYLGYETFADFKKALIYNEKDIHRKYPLHIDDPSVFAREYFNKISSNIDWMGSNLDLGILMGMAQDLQTHEHIFILGNAQSGNSANNLMFGLLQMGKLSKVATSHRDYGHLISSLKSDSMVIVISNYGSFFDLFVAPDCFKDKPDDTVIYLLTCNSELSRPVGVDHILLCNEDAGFAGGNLSIDIVLNLLLQLYRGILG